MERGQGVLLVEDEPMIALMLADMVEAQGLPVVAMFRANGEALAFLRDHRPEVAIVDFSLADGCAFGLASALKMQGTPFCVISGYHRSVAGPLFDDILWLDKPFSQDQLGCALLACLRERKHNPSYV